MARKVVLSGRVPDGEYWAARAGDSPFAPGILLAPGTRLERAVPAWTYPPASEEPVIPFDYDEVWANGEIMVVDKPHFLPVTGNGRIQRETVQTRLRRRVGEHAVVCHRLDRLTAGLVLCSLNPRTRGVYQQLFAHRQIRKEYEAVLSADVSFPDWTRLDVPMRKTRGSRRVEVAAGGVMTTTWIKGVGNQVTLRPVTGHTHQLRVVAAHLAAPIVGDDTYPADTGAGLWDFGQPLQLLANRLEFTDPLGGAQRVFVSRRRLTATIG